LVSTPDHNSSFKFSFSNFPFSLSFLRTNFVFVTLPFIHSIFWEHSAESSKLAPFIVSDPAIDAQSSDLSSHDLQFDVSSSQNDDGALSASSCLSSDVSSTRNISLLFTRDEFQTQGSPQIGGGSVSSSHWIGVGIGTATFLLIVLILIALWCWILNERKQNHTTEQIIFDADEEVSVERLIRFDSSFDEFGEILDVGGLWDNGYVDTLEEMIF
jgi:hypothetical protein